MKASDKAFEGFDEDEEEPPDEVWLELEPVEEELWLELDEEELGDWLELPLPLDEEGVPPPHETSPRAVKEAIATKILFFCIKESFLFFDYVAKNREDAGAVFQFHVPKIKTAFGGWRGGGPRFFS